MQVSPAASARPLPYAEFVSLVALLMALNAMAIDIMLPALQQIGSSLSVLDPNTRQLPLTAYIAFFGLSQLFYGPLADHFGRRLVLLVGLVIYCAGGFGAAIAGDFPTLLAMRAIQGIGAAATRVIAVSIVRDTYSGRRMASVMSLAMMIFMVVPILAPNIGQAILLVAGWRSIFAFIALFGVVMSVWAFVRLPETLAPANKRPLHAGPILQAFRIVLGNRTALGYTLGTGLIFGCLFGFLNSAQQIYQGIYDIGRWFPLAFSFAAILIAVASFTNSRLVGRLGMRRLSHLALTGYAIVAAVLCLTALIDDGQAPFWAFFGLTAISFCLFGFIGTNFNALAMEPLGKVAGTASSVLGFVQTFVGGAFGAAIGYFYNDTVLPLALGFLLLSLASFAVIVFADRSNLYGRRDQRSAAAPLPAE